MTKLYDNRSTYDSKIITGMRGEKIEIITSDDYFVAKDSYQNENFYSHMPLGQRVFSTPLHLLNINEPNLCLYNEIGEIFKNYESTCLVYREETDQLATLDPDNNLKIIDEFTLNSGWITGMTHITIEESA